MHRGGDAPLLERFLHRRAVLHLDCVLGIHTGVASEQLWRVRDTRRLEPAANRGTDTEAGFYFGLEDLQFGQHDRRLQGIDAH